MPGRTNAGIATIRDLAPESPWRTHLLPARFDRAQFHVEAGSQEGGRRIVTHEFPKRSYPYSEDMGRKATEFSVRGYIIQYPMDTNIQLYSRDYTLARNILQERLDQGLAGTLQLPLMRPLIVVCSRYRMTEEERVGGYVTFDMTFVELGVPPFKSLQASADDLLKASQDLRDETLQGIMLARVNPPAPVRGRVNVRALAGGAPFPIG